MTLTRMSELSGLPLYYDRYSPVSYGVSATRFSPYFDDDFLVDCESFFVELQNLLTTYGFTALQVWSGGVGREGSGASYHHLNRAFDFDALIFEDKEKWVADTFETRPYLYLAIESVLRIHFGTVLNYYYDQAHRDHFHFDNGTTIKFKRDARSHVLYLQLTLTKLFNQDVGQSGIDGVYGGNTEQAMRRALKQLKIGGLSDKKNWLDYLRVSAEVAMDHETSIVGEITHA